MTVEEWEREHWTIEDSYNTLMELIAARKGLTYRRGFGIIKAVRETK